MVVICWENGGYYCLSSAATILKNHLGANSSSRKKASDASRLTKEDEDMRAKCFLLMIPREILESSLPALSISDRVS